MGLRIDAPAPPLSVEDPGGGGSEWVVFARAANDIEAHLLTGVLNEAGIETYAVTDRSAPGAWLHGGSDPWAPVTVYVRRLQYEDGRIVLAELALSDEAAVPLPRPAPQRRTAGVVVWWVAALALGALFTGIALAQTAAFLERCDWRLVCEETP
ncbi:MAG TPA: DUF2007 domain-containing protein [Actinomycetota bacterium]|nr:DUF2007 domain-containing protein [Actinomycetota bacterium]